MATSSYAKSLLGGLPADLKQALTRVSEYIFDRNLAFGPLDPSAAQSKSENMSGRYVKVVTKATANQEAAIAHGLGSVPVVMWQVLDPTVVNSRFVGDLTISRAADANRIYVTSASTNATVWMYVE